MKLPDNVISFVIAVRSLMQKDDLYLEATPKTRTKLVILMEEQLVNKENRRDVLRAITGIQMPVWTQNGLTQGTHSAIIETIKDGEYVEELRWIERFIQNEAEAGHLYFEIANFPHWQGTSVSSVPGENYIQASF